MWCTSRIGPSRRTNGRAPAMIVRFRWHVVHVDRAIDRASSVIQSRSFVIGRGARNNDSIASGVAPDASVTRCVLDAPHHTMHMIQRTPCVIHHVVRIGVDMRPAIGPLAIEHHRLWRVIEAVERDVRRLHGAILRCLSAGHTVAAVNRCCGTARLA